MHARNRDAGELPAHDERVLILAYLIALRDIRIEIALAVELAEVGGGAPDRGSNTQNVPHCGEIDDRQCAGMRRTDRTYIHVWPRLIGVVCGVAKHLCPCRELCMDFKADGRTIHDAQFTTKRAEQQTPCLRLIEDLSESVGECFKCLGVFNRHFKHFPACLAGK